MKKLIQHLLCLIGFHGEGKFLGGDWSGFGEYESVVVCKCCGRTIK